MIANELNRFNQAEMAQLLEQLSGMNADQQAVFDAVVDAARDAEHNVSACP